MDDEIKVFELPAHGSIRLAKLDERGVPWFVARDICDALGITWSGSTLQAVEPEDQGCHRMTTLKGAQGLTIVSEAGHYQLIFKSRKPEAKAFKRWVTNEVIPSIRKTGSYSKTREDKL